MVLEVVVALRLLAQTEQAPLVETVALAPQHQFQAHRLLTLAAVVEAQVSPVAELLVQVELVVEEMAQLTVELLLVEPLVPEVAVAQQKAGLKVQADLAS